MAFLKLLLPSWRFFEKAGDTPVLQYCLLGLSESNEWENVIDFSGHPLLPLINAKGNLNLYKQGLVQSFVQRIAEGLDANKSVQYSFLKKMAQQRIHERHLKILSQFETKGIQYKLRIIKYENSLMESKNPSSKRTLVVFFESSIIEFRGFSC